MKSIVSGIVTAQNVTTHGGKKLATCNHLIRASGERKRPPGQPYC